MHFGENNCKLFEWMNAGGAKVLKIGAMQRLSFDAIIHLYFRTFRLGLNCDAADSFTSSNSSRIFFARRIDVFSKWMNGLKRAINAYLPRLTLAKNSEPQQLYRIMADLVMTQMRQIVETSASDQNLLFHLCKRIYEHKKRVFRELKRKCRYFLIGSDKNDHNDWHCNGRANNIRLKIDILIAY